MFTIYCDDDRKEFYRWDLNQKVVVPNESIKQVHFCNRSDICSLVTEVYEIDGVRVADVPNILFHTAKTIRVYGYTDTHTLVETRFRVNERTKPTDYVYTEVEIKTWDKLESQVGYYTPVLDDSGYLSWSASKDTLPFAPGANIKGEPGTDGYTPVKGVDYFTEADKEELVASVMAALPNGDEVSY